MSKIDTSELGEVLEYGGGDIGEDLPDYYSVKYKGKEYKYFPSLEGARAYLEVLRNGKDTIIPRGIEEEEIRTVPKVHGVLQGTGSAGGNQSRKRTYPDLL